MINERQKKHIKQVLGHRYVKHIANYLAQQNIYNRNGKLFSKSQITNVMNGVSHPVIEEAIFKVVANKKADLQKRDQLLNNNMLLNKKSAAATADL